MVPIQKYIETRRVDINQPVMTNACPENLSLLSFVFCHKIYIKFKVFTSVNEIGKYFI
jgi:hypothetical protein